MDPGIVLRGASWLSRLGDRRWLFGGALSVGFGIPVASYYFAAPSARPDAPAASTEPGVAAPQRPRFGGKATDPEPGSLILPDEEEADLASAGVGAPDVPPPAAGTRAGGWGAGPGTADALRAVAAGRPPGAGKASGAERRQLAGKGLNSPGGGGGSGGGGFFGGPKAAAAGPAGISVPKTAPPPTFFDKWLADVKNYLKGKPITVPPTASPFQPAAPAPIQTGGVGTIGLDGYSAGPGGASAPRPPEVKAGGDGASLKKGAAGGGAGGTGTAAPPATQKPSCSAPAQAISAPTRLEPNRVRCVTVPTSNAKPTRTQLSNARARIAAIAVVLEESALRPGIDALKAAAGWAAEDVAHAKTEFAAFQQRHASLKGALSAASGLGQAQRTLSSLRPLDEWLEKPDGPSKGVETALDHLNRAKDCLGADLDIQRACHDNEVIPALGRALRFQHEQMAFLKESLEKDADLKASLDVLQALAAANANLPATAPERALYERLRTFLAPDPTADSGVTDTARAAEKLRRASSAWDTHTTNPGEGFKQKVSDQLDAFSRELLDLGTIGAYSVPGGTALFMRSQSVLFSLQDSLGGWRQSTNGSGKPIDRTEGAVDGSKGAVDAMQGLAEILVRLDAMIAAH
ncbi:MAG: hypothetical protein HY553_02755 [Elusimicrobia bacterium]|nr:hypothetical protein [Elusimicrobiota bacterium]